MRNIDSLKNTSEFKEVYEKGKSVANGLLVLYVLPSGQGEKRLGISVSKKVGNSVVRHRVTRLIRESFCKLEAEIPDGYRFVVVARYRTAGKNFSDVCGALLYLFRKMNLVSQDDKKAINCTN